MAIVRLANAQGEMAATPATSPSQRNSQHAELCALGERWLRGSGRCRVVLRDPFKAAVASGECPDVIGWGGGISILIECKTSRRDFLADRRKCFRVKPELGMGDFRLFLAPPGIIHVADLPEGWGLLVAESGKVRIHGPMPRQYTMKCYGVTRKTRNAIHWYPAPFKGNKDAENAMLVSALARSTTREGIV